MKPINPSNTQEHLNCGVFDSHMKLGEATAKEIFKQERGDEDKIEETKLSERDVKDQLENVMYKAIKDNEKSIFKNNHMDIEKTSWEMSKAVMTNFAISPAPQLDRMAAILSNSIKEIVPDEGQPNWRLFWSRAVKAIFSSHEVHLPSNSTNIINV